MKHIVSSIIVLLVFLAGPFCGAEVGTKYKKAPGVNENFAQTVLKSIQYNLDIYQNMNSAEISSEENLNVLFGSPVSEREKEVNLEQARKIEKSVQNLQSNSSPEGKRDAINNGAFAIFANFLKINELTLRLATDMNMLKVVKDFSTRARQEDSQIKNEDVIQASRNVWTAAALQKILGVKVQLTDSLYGYSMLYPYTDNVFDDPNLDANAKKIFVQNFGRLLLEKKIPDLSPHEIKVEKMINAMYRQYSPADFPDVQQSILSIFHAQVASVKQLKPDISEIEVLETTAFKGATSVLADAYLANPNLSESDFNLAIQFGFVLQLIDDLQDFTNDREIGQKTLFSYPDKSPEKRGIEVVKMMEYARNSVGKSLLSNPRHLPLGASIFGFLQLLAFEAIAKQSEGFTPQFVAQMEARSPIPFRELKSADIEKRLYSIVDKMTFK